MRASSLPRLIVAQTPDPMIGDISESPYSALSMHSRNSSGASDSYSPSTPTFSFHEHVRHPSSSSSSLATTPPQYESSIESLHRISRTTLHDLVEDPHEREDAFDLCDIAFDSRGIDRNDPAELHYPSEADFCPRQCYSASALERPTLDYSFTDGFCEMNSDNESPLRISKQRRESGDSPVTALASRIGNRFPSFSKRHERTPSSPTIGRRGSVKSAPASRVPSRAPSFRLPSLTKIPINTAESEGEVSRPETPVSSVTEVEQPSVPSKSLEIQVPRREEPIDRKALASTPLLPMPPDDPRESDDNLVRSPLQSPTVVEDAHRSFFASPSSSPILSETISSPVLSAQISVASLGNSRSSQVVSPTDAPSMGFNGPQDKWAKKLGHANFSVFPEPYLPEKCDVRACKRLLEDWESARKQFMNQAARTSEHYGPTSQVYKFTEKKWAEIDAQWKKNHELVVAKAMANGESPVYQPLAEPAPLTKLPPLNDEKFPQLDESDIVGPMVQYAKITHKSSKKTAFLRFFNDMRFPSNTLGRSPSGFGR